MEQQPPIDKSKRNLIAIIAVLAIAIIAYSILQTNDVTQTSFLFVGLPALLSIAIIKFTNPTSGYGVMFKVVTLFLLISGMFLGEGIACILFAAPIFYGVGVILVAIGNYLNKNDKNELYMWAVLPVLLVLGEAGDIYKNPKLQTVKVVQSYKNASIENFNRQDVLKNEIPNFFKVAAFPTPTNMVGQGIEVGAKRQIDFHSQTKGLGALVLEVTESSPNKVVFKNKSDNSHIHRWLDWREVEVTLEKQGDKTEVIWRSDYYCELEPSWYFEPLERLAVKKSSQYLLDAYFSSEDGSSSTH